jgi:hypothetical protein
LLGNLLDCQFGIGQVILCDLAPLSIQQILKSHSLGAQLAPEGPGRHGQVARYLLKLGKLAGLSPQGHFNLADNVSLCSQFLQQTGL